MLKGIALLFVGASFIWAGVSAWKDRREQRIGVLEAAILKVGQAEPLPENRWDRAMAYVQPVLLLTFGPIMVFLGMVILFV